MKKKKNLCIQIVFLVSLLILVSCNSHVDYISLAEEGENKSPKLEETIAPPATVKNLSITVNSANSLTLDWDAGDTNTTGYKIAYYPESDTNTKSAATNCEFGSLIESSDITGTSHTLTGLSRGQEYIFRVCALNQNGEVDVNDGIQASEFTNFSDAPYSRVIFENHTAVGSGSAGKITPIEDYNGDGYDDIVKNFPSGEIQILSGENSESLLSFTAFHGLFKVIGDYNNDGTKDFAISNEKHNCIAGNSCGRISIFSGTDGSLIYNKEGTVANNWMGRYFDHLGDQNSDGYDDVLIYYDDHIEIISGIDNSILHTLPSPYPSTLNSASVIGDYNNDGTNDYAINNGTHFIVYSGVNNSTLADLNIYTGSSYPPPANMGDYNSDGHDDVLISDESFNSDDGRVMIISGADNSILLQITAPASSEDELGKWDVCPIPDLNSDGINDIFADVDSLSSSSYVYSGADGTPLQVGVHFPYFTFDTFYGCNGTGQFFDINNDGKFDFRTGHEIITF